MPLIAQKIQSNKADCHRLANRCLSLLRRVHDQMSGRWEDSPPSLLKALKTFETYAVLLDTP